MVNSINTLFKSFKNILNKYFKEPTPQVKMKIGDTVVMSSRNLNHLGNSVNAYAGMKGVVTDIYENGSFALNCTNSILVVPMCDAYGQPKKGVWVWLNGEHIFHKRTKK